MEYFRGLVVLMDSDVALLGAFININIYNNI